MKTQEIHRMSNEELGVEVERLRRRLYELRCQSVTEKVENPNEIGAVRKDIARLMTIRRQRELQQLGRR